MEQTQKCRACNEVRPLSDFYFRKETQKYKAVCKCCCISGKRIEKSDSHKVCKTCQVEKSVSEFQKAGGGKWLQPYCKPCDSERKKKYNEENKEKVLNSKMEYYKENKSIIRKKERDRYYSNKEPFLNYQKEYAKKNPEKISARRKRYLDVKGAEINERKRLDRINNPEKYRAKDKERREKRTPEQKERDAKAKRVWTERNKDRLAELLVKRKDRKREQRRVWCNNKSATDIGFRILKNLRSRSRYALKSQGAIKADATETLLGCSIPFFKEYFKNLFTAGMTWEAFMSGEIHIDHIKPCSKFDLTILEQQKECFHYTNLQPLWWRDNLIKSNKYEGVCQKA